MQVLNVVGARPNFVKVAPVTFALRNAGHREILVHTGQHYDQAMSAALWCDLELPAAGYSLDVRSATPGRQLAAMLAGIEEILENEQPDAVIVYGDTNSSLAGALAARNTRAVLVHVEAGLRSFNRDMPEEINRILIDHAADVLVCPTRSAESNLRAEQIRQKVHLVGDTMLDAVRLFRRKALERGFHRTLGLTPGGYLLATLHRPYTVDDSRILSELVSAFRELGEPVVFPVHPRTRKWLVQAGLQCPVGNVRLLEPVGYLDMLDLISHARAVLTDSGGVQKEAFFLRVPCLTLRPETEWVETVETGWNQIVPRQREALRRAVETVRRPSEPPDGLFGGGYSAEAIVRLLEAECGG